MNHVVNHPEDPIAETSYELIEGSGVTVLRLPNKFGLRDIGLSRSRFRIHFRRAQP